MSGIEQVRHTQQASLTAHGIGLSHKHTRRARAPQSLATGWLVWDRSSQSAFLLSSLRESVAPLGVVCKFTAGSASGRPRHFLVTCPHTAVICVCGSPRMQKNKTGDRFWVQDCSAATENILLAATALNLGSVWMAAYPSTLLVRQVKGILNLPDDVTPLNIIGLGYPAEEKEARTQYDEKRVHWESYNPVELHRRRIFHTRKNETMLEDTNKE